MKEYKLTFKGRVENATAFLSDLLEQQNTPLNKITDVKFKDVAWDTDLSENSTVELLLNSSGTLAKTDLQLIREQYALKVVSRVGA